MARAGGMLGGVSDEFDRADGPYDIATERGKGWFCADCGTPLFFDARGGRRYPFCPACGYVRYRNPAVGVAVVIRDDAGRVLLGRRATGDYAGLWCIPCGYVEWDEDVREAAIRETLEETGLVVQALGVVAVHSNFHNRDRQTVGIWFEGRVTGGEMAPADGELTELRFCDPSAPPPLAFPTDALVLAQLTRG